MKQYEHVWFVIHRSKCVSAHAHWQDELLELDYWSCIEHLERFGFVLCAIRDYPEKELVEYYLARELS